MGVETTAREVAHCNRRDLAAAYRLVAHFNLDDSIFTHISAKAGPDKETFLINAYGLRFTEVTAENLVEVDLDGNIVHDPLGAGINAAGFLIHSAVHEARPDLACVMHTHTVAGVAVASQADGLLPLNQWSLQFHDRLAYHAYEGIALREGEKARLVADLGSRLTMVLRNHGLLTCGRTISQAFKLMYNLDRACRAQIAIQSSGSQIASVPDKICKLTADQYEMWETDLYSRDVEWEAYLRLVGEEYPDFHKSSV